MIFRPIVSGGGTAKYKFSVEVNVSGGQMTLNGTPISVGDNVEIEPGEICDFYGSVEGVDFVMDGGLNVPYASYIQSPISTRAGHPPLHNIFVMPKDNVSIKV